MAQVYYSNMIIDFFIHIHYYISVYIQCGLIVYIQGVWTYIETTFQPPLSNDRLVSKVKLWPRHSFVSLVSQELRFHCHMLWVFFVISELRLGVIVRFVDIGGIVDHCFRNVHSCWNIGSKLRKCNQCIKKTTKIY